MLCASWLRLQTGARSYVLNLLDRTVRVNKTYIPKNALRKTTGLSRAKIQQDFMRAC
jgi:hypothetical protein